MLQKHDTTQERMKFKQQLKQKIDQTSSAKEYVVCIFEIWRGMITELNDWETALEKEITQAGAVEKRLAETELDNDTKDIIKQRVLSSLIRDIINDD